MALVWAMCVFFVHELWHVSVIHVNIRILLGVFKLQFSLSGLLRLLNVWVVGHGPSGTGDAAGHPVWHLLGHTTSWLHMLFVTISSYTMIFVALERFLATRYSGGYEYRGPRIALTLLGVEVSGEKAAEQVALCSGMMFVEPSRLPCGPDVPLMRSCPFPDHMRRSAVNYRVARTLWQSKTVKKPLENL